MLDGGRVVEFQGKKVRSLLAMLLLNAGQVVSVDRLCEALWDDAAPATATSTVQIYVSQLRKALGAQFVETRSPGYVLVVDPDRVDASRFERLVAEGRAMVVGDPTAAISRLTEALGLWRGPALADFTYENFAGAHIARLEELRLVAVEERTEAELALGRHGEVVGPLRLLVTDHPLRERLWGQLVLALYRSGRQGEALRALSEVRRLLGDELGIEPGPALRQLEADVLAQHPRLEVAAPPTDGRPAGGVSPGTNLRAELSTFVGREEQLRDATKLLGTTRLLTLVGPGGAGKTRMAVRVAADMVGRLQDGVWLVELAPLADPTLLAGHVLSALGLVEERGATPAQSLRRHLAKRRLLLIADNCEHLTAACAALLKDLLGACEGLRVLATSREPLGIPGESLWPVPPLSLPGPGDDAPDRLMESEAVRLFVERASAADPGFALSPDDAPALAEVCRRLDGLPLAIELAAARARSLSVPDIATRLRDRFALLVGRDPTAPDRHHTLRAAVDWSHEALATDEQVLFRRLSVFAGGFGVDAVEHVCRGPRPALDVMEGLPALVDKSLVIADRSSSTTRYRLLETLRQYGAESLAQSGEEATIRAGHLGWVCSLAEQAEPWLEGPEQAAWLQRLDTDEDNVRVALEWAVSHPDGDEGLRAAAALWRYWQIRSRFDEGRRWLRRLLDVTTGASPEVRAKAMTSVAVLLLIQSEAPLSPQDADLARTMLDGSLAIRREAGDRLGVAAVLLNLGGMYFRLWDVDAARVCFEETLLIGREIGEKRLVAASLTNLASVVRRLADTPGHATDGSEAASLFEECVAAWRELGDGYATARALQDLALSTKARGDYGQARLQLEEAVAIQRELDDRHGLAGSIAGLAGCARSEDDHATARSLLLESIELQKELLDPFSVARGLNRLGDMSWMEGDTAEARRLFGEAAAIGRTIELKLPLWTARDNLGTIALEDGDAGEARKLFEEARAAAQKSHDMWREEPWWFGVSAVVALAEGNHAEAAEHCTRLLSSEARRLGRPSKIMAAVLDVVAVLAVEIGDHRRAALLVGAAQGYRGDSRIVRFRSRPEYQQAFAELAERVGAGFESLQAEGAAMPVDEIVDLAEAVVTGRLKRAG